MAEWKPDLSELRLSLAIVVNGDVSALKAFLADLKTVLDRHGLKLVFQTTSADRLRIVREADYREGRT